MAEIPAWQCVQTVWTRPINAESTLLTAARKHLEGIKGDDLIAWRIADQPDRPSADERNLPDEFPMGRFAVCYSDELAVGEVKGVRYFAQDLAVWRGEDGVARVIDAYCAHYGANMAVAGSVHGNLLECPFHGWRWDEKGACKEVPYSKSIPPQAKRDNCVPSWPTIEANGMVNVWYHPEKLPPLWECHSFEALGLPGWTSYQKYEWKVYIASANMADNSVDNAHFRFVHGTQNVPSSEFTFDGVKKSSASYPRFETPRGPVDGAIESWTVGPGQGIVRFSGICNTVMLSANAPIERDVYHVRFAYSQIQEEAEGPRSGVARAIIRDLTSQLDQDKVILDRLRNLDRPLICEGDGPFARQKVYYDQFFVSKQG